MCTFICRFNSIKNCIHLSSDPNQNNFEKKKHRAAQLNMIICVSLTLTQRLIQVIRMFVCVDHKKIDKTIIMINKINFSVDLYYWESFDNPC